MSSWMRLLPDKARTFYGVPRQVASMPGNLLFGMEYNPFDMDGPWPLVAFLAVPDHPNLVASVIATVQPEFVENGEYDPLTEPGGYFALNGDELSGLISLITKQADAMSGLKTPQRPPFRLLDEFEFSEFHLRPELVPRSKQYYYIQEYDTKLTYLPDRYHDDHMITLVKISLSRSLPSPRLLLGLARFPQHRLRLDRFDPFEMGQAMVILDSFGLQELAGLLRHYRQYVL